MQLNIDKIHDTIRVNLSDIAADFHFIRLETRPECLIASAKYYVSDKYILAQTRSAIYQFDAEGRYIRTLAVAGEGPREFTRASWVIDENNNRVIIADEGKVNYLLCFDLNTGEYLGDIPKAVKGTTRRMALTAYGSLACVPYMSPGEKPDPFYLYWQDMSGKLLDFVPGKPNLAIMRDNYLAATPDGYRYMLAYNNRDTIYTLSDKNLIPWLTINHGETVPESMEAQGYRTMKIAMETDRYLFLTRQLITKVTSSGTNTSIAWSHNDYLLDKQRHRAFLTNGLYNDFMGDPQPAGLFTIQPNNLICTAMQAPEVIGITERAIENPKSDQKLIGRMKQLREAVLAEDNPVLLIGIVR
jgi:hypothetical protein